MNPPLPNKFHKENLSNAKRVIDCFHIQMPAGDAVQKIRIRHCWEAIQQETNTGEKTILFYNIPYDTLCGAMTKIKN